jgi:hypothetical protein
VFLGLTSENQVLTHKVFPRAEAVRTYGNHHWKFCFFRSIGKRKIVFISPGQEQFVHMVIIIGKQIICISKTNFILIATPKHAVSRRAAAACWAAAVCTNLLSHTNTLVYKYGSEKKSSRRYKKYNTHYHAKYFYHTEKYLGIQL